MEPINSTKKCSGSMNNSKNKLNSEIIYNFHYFPNAYIMYGPCAVLRNVSLFIYFFGQILINKFFFRKKEKKE